VDAALPDVTTANWTGVVAGLAYGIVLDLWFWPFSLDDGSAVAYVAGAPVATNLGRFWVFHLTTSLGWDLPRAATNALLMVLAGPAVLAALRRASRRASFGVPVVFEPAPSEVATQGVGTGT
jgi:energy-coupling factor transport system substrate-specific component